MITPANKQNCRPRDGRLKAETRGRDSLRLRTRSRLVLARVPRGCCQDF